MLHGLEAADGAAELAAVERVLGGHRGDAFERACNHQGAGGGAGGAKVQCGVRRGRHGIGHRIDHQGIARLTSDVETFLDGIAPGQKGDMRAALDIGEDHQSRGIAAPGNSAGRPGDVPLGAVAAQDEAGAGGNGQRAVGDGKTGRGQEPAGEHGFGERQRQRVASGDAQNGEGFVGSNAEAARRFGEEAEMQAGFSQSVPRGLGEIAVFGGRQDLGRNDGAEQAFGGIDKDGIGQGGNS